MSITTPSGSTPKPIPSKRLAARSEVAVKEPDQEALARAMEVATRFKWFVVVGNDGPLNSRGKCCFKEAGAAQCALDTWPEAIGCYAPDGRFYRKAKA